jgi:predicted metal-dependent hydrolase
VVEKAFAEGVLLTRAGRFFEAHEAFEEAWRAADPRERDFFQGLVHVVVAWYQAGRGNRVGCERQLEKAQRRLARYAPTHRGLDVGVILRQVAAARPLELAPLELAEAQPVEQPADSDVQPPLTVEEEQ